MRIYFVTDIHGSEVCFRKFLNSYEVYRPDVMIVGGDITGKVMVPVVAENGGRWRAETSTGVARLQGAESRDAFLRRMADLGTYAWVTTEDDYARARSDEDYVNGVFRELILARVTEWMRLAEQRLASAPCRVFVSAGNDDYWEVDDILCESTRVECPDRMVIDLEDGIQLLSLGYANPTPWDCPRDVPEPRLGECIDDLAGQLGSGPVIFNLHVPPFDTPLDGAPALDAELRPKMGPMGVERAPVGSVAVRERIERYAPVLSLHGHVHESAGVFRLGPTVTINPGSEYAQGLLRGALIELVRGRVKREQLLCG